MQKRPSPWILDFKELSRKSLHLRNWQAAVHAKQTHTLAQLLFSRAATGGQLSWARSFRLRTVTSVCHRLCRQALVVDLSGRGKNNTPIFSTLAIPEGPARDSSARVVNLPKGICNDFCYVRLLDESYAFTLGLTGTLTSLRRFHGTVKGSLYCMSRVEFSASSQASPLSGPSFWLQWKPRKKPEPFVLGGGPGFGFVCVFAGPLCGVGVQGKLSDRSI